MVSNTFFADSGKETGSASIASSSSASMALFCLHKDISLLIFTILSLKFLILITRSRKVLKLAAAIFDCFANYSLNL